MRSRTARQQSKQPGASQWRAEQAKRVRAYAQVMLAIGDALAALPYDPAARGQRLADRLGACRSEALDLMYDTLASPNRVQNARLESVMTPVDPGGQPARSARAADDGVE
jgi:hypothetical protein